MHPTGETTPPDPLDLDHAIPVAGLGLARRRAGEVACSACGATLTTQYYDVAAAPVCAGCKTQLERHLEPVRGWSVVGRAALFGVPAAVAGGAIYYAVAAVTGFEIGLVAILCGFMVGWAVRKSARGRGGLRLQVLAVALTYFSVALAYLPFAIQGAMEAANEGLPTVAAEAPAQAAEGAPAELSESVPDEAAALAAAPEAGTGAEEATARAAQLASAETDAPAAGGALLLGIGALLLFSLALPVLVVFGSLPGGAISALIIGIGMHQAWRMTGVPEVKIQGPFQLAPAAPAPDAAAV